MPDEKNYLVSSEKVLSIVVVSSLRARAEIQNDSHMKKKRDENDRLPLDFRRFHRRANRKDFCVRPPSSVE